MFFVYILQSLKNDQWYIGFTSDLKERIKRHNSNSNPSTKNIGPWKLIFYEGYLNKYDALRREKYLKNTRGRTTLKSMLKEYLKNHNKK